MASLVLSCAHAVCAVPEWYRERFRGFEEVLTSHRGWDPGALNLSQAFAMKTRTPLAHGEVTRLLIDLTRRPDDPERFPELGTSLTDDQRQKLHDRYFAPYFELLCERIASGMKLSPPVVHLSVHTFPRQLGDLPRATDLGVSFDPERHSEAAFAAHWITGLRCAAPELRVDSNPRYHGTHDGTADLLRRRFPQPDYLCLELEVCQSFFLDGLPWRWDRVKRLLLDSFTHG